jgi:hypothetical protein
MAISITCIDTLYYTPTIEALKRTIKTLGDRFSIEYDYGSGWLGKSLGFHGKHGIAEHYGVKL